MSQVTTINGVSYPIDVSYKCIRGLSDKYGHKSPVTTIQHVANVFQPLFDAYAGLDESELDQIDPNQITYDQIDVFSDLLEQSILAADPSSDFKISEEDKFKTFTRNPQALGELMVAFMLANVPQDEVVKAKKKKPVKRDKVRPVEK